MKSYEGLFIFPPEATPEARKAQEKQLEDLIKKFQGVVTQKTEVGKRPLGYHIRKFREGYFFHVDFQLDTLKLAELRKVLELQEELMKYMITVKVKAAQPAQDKPQDKPSTSASGTPPVRHTAVSH